MTGPARLFVTATLLLLISSMGETSQITGPFSKEAIGRGKVDDVLRFRETKARDGEQMRDWVLASNAYRLASQAAKISGQYQKAIDYENKAVEMGERAGNYVLQARGIIQLVLMHNLVRQTDMVKALLEKGFEEVK